MNRLRMAFIGLFAFSFLLLANAQKADSTKVPAANDTTQTVVGDTLTADSAMALIDADLAGPDDLPSLHRAEIALPVKGFNVGAGVFHAVHIIGQRDHRDLILLQQPLGDVAGGVGKNNKRHGCVASCVNL